MHRFAIVLLSLALLLIGCPSGTSTDGTPTLDDVEVADQGSGDQPEPEPPGPVVTTIRIEPRGLRIAPGRPPELVRAQVYDQHRETMDVDVEWHSLDPETVSINERGEIIALGPLGPAFVTASAGDVIAEQIPIYVVDPRSLPQPEGSGEGSGDEAADGAEGAGGATGDAKPDEGAENGGAAVDGSGQIE